MAEADLSEFVRRHRVHFDVRPDVVVSPAGRVTVGFELRLFAVHDKGAQALPGCCKCDDLVAGLRSLATEVLPRDERPTISSVRPFEPALYDSREVPGADEVALTLLLSHREGYERPVDACQARCLKEVRQRLKAFHVPER